MIEPAAPRKPFAEFLQQARKGGLHTELSDELADLVLRVKETGKKGTLNLKIEVAPSADDDAIVVVSDTVRVVAPRPTVKPTIFYPDKSGNLSRRDPRQMELLPDGPRALAGGGQAEHDDHEATRRTA